LGVSQAARAHLEEGLGPDCCEWYDNLEYGAAAELFRRSSTFVSLSTDEGFGLPYVEALASGCNLIAVRNRVTEEVLGNAGILIDDGPEDILVAQFRQLGNVAWPSEELRRTRASQYSWDTTAGEISAILRSAASS
jgi:glycosyltransferase involved in cell wall biosynthesis